MARQQQLAARLRPSLVAPLFLRVFPSLSFRRLIPRTVLACLCSSSGRQAAPRRANASVKNVSTIACRGVCSFIFAEGWNSRLGGAAAPGTQRGMKLRPPYLRLYAEWETKKAPENRC